MTYPSHDMDSREGKPGALIVSVDPGSPADIAGLEPGMRILRVEGQVLRDYIDWLWLTDEPLVCVTVSPQEGVAYDTFLERDEYIDWGLAFDGVIYDGVKRCRNACTFCFMTQLPRGMRESLYVRDDDFRLSFLQGTFVTFTNLSADDEERIIRQNLSPLRLSLHAVSPDVRGRLIGAHAAEGFDVLERLLAAGIEFHTQIVLVPGENDGDELDRTLSWALAQPGILDVGIVPLGFTRHQTRFDRSFDDPADAMAVLEQVARFQANADEQRGFPWVYAADEFYMNAYATPDGGTDVLDHLPDDAFYGDFSMYEDGIGMVRAFVDDWRAAGADGHLVRLGDALRTADCQLRLLTGELMAPLFRQLIGEAGLTDRVDAIGVPNRYFGGNVNVTGLLTGQDLLAAVADWNGGKAGSRFANGERILFAIPDAVFNADGLTLDGKTAADLSQEAAAPVCVVSCTVQGIVEDVIRELECRFLS